MNKIAQIVKASVAELAEELENENLAIQNLTNETALYGAKGNIDSLALVSLITDLEDKISDEFDKDITLADEKAMSQSISPFKDIGSLCAYIQKLLDK